MHTEIKRCVPKAEYPGLFETSTGAVFLMASPRTGTCVHAEAQWRLGDICCDFNHRITPFIGNVYLKGGNLK